MSETKKLAIVTPTRDGQYDLNYVSALIETVKVCADNGIEVKPTLWSGCSDIIAGRNKAFNNWFYLSEADYFMFIDSDMGWSPQSVLRMIEKLTHKEVGAVALNYPKKVLDIERIFQIAQTYGQRGEDVNLQQCIFAAYDYVTYGKHEMVTEGELAGMCKVEGVGMGMFMIDRAGAEVLVKHTESEGKLEICEFGDDKFKATGYPLFNPQMVDGKNIGEDFSFCSRLNDAGLNLWVLADEPVRHVGNYAFDAMFCEYMFTMQDFAKFKKESETVTEGNNG